METACIIIALILIAILLLVIEYFKKFKAEQNKYVLNEYDLILINILKDFKIFLKKDLKGNDGFCPFLHRFYQGELVFFASSFIRNCIKKEDQEPGYYWFKNNEERVKMVDTLINKIYKGEINSKIYFNEIIIE